jgi:hypothetical protein
VDPVRSNRRHCTFLETTYNAFGNIEPLALGVEDPWSTAALKKGFVTLESRAFLLATSMRA